VAAAKSLWRRNAADFERWAPDGSTLRLHIGLENVDDLKAGLDRGLAALKAAGHDTILPKALCQSSAAAQRRMAKQAHPYKSGFCGHRH